MKTKILIILAVTLFLIGCVTQTNAQTNDVDMTALLIDIAQKANQASAPVNPYVLPISALLGFIGIVLGFFKKSKAEKHLAVVVKGVELSNDPNIKKTIEQEAIKAGIHESTDKAVQKILG